MIDKDYVERVSKNMQYMQFSGQEILDKGRRVRWYHLLFHPLYRALKSYFLQGGFRAGTRGLLFAVYTFTGTFNWWAYAWDKQNSPSRLDVEKQLQNKWNHQNKEL